MAGNIIELNDGNFDTEVLQSNLPTLVDFWAPWCGPCLALTPVIEMIANERHDTLKVCKLNVDDNPSIAAKYGIRGIPTMILFKNGHASGQITGAVPKQQIEAMIEAS